MHEIRKLDDSWDAIGCPNSKRKPINLGLPCRFDGPNCTTILAFGRSQALGSYTSTFGGPRDLTLLAMGSPTLGLTSFTAKTSNGFDDICDSETRSFLK